MLFSITYMEWPNVFHTYTHFKVFLFCIDRIISVFVNYMVKKSTNYTDFLLCSCLVNLITIIVVTFDLVV